MKTQPLISTDQLQPVIICGGKGTRLWPMSRELYPKQFMEITPGKTLFRDTIQRLSALNCAQPMILCNQQHRFMVGEQMLAENAKGRIILEPKGRDTAPAVAVAALLADRDQVLFVMPADHAIADGPAFQKAAAKGLKEASLGRLVCFGIHPTTPETGYGYIQVGEETGPGVCRIKRFVEKPDLAKAEKYLASSDHFWNSGIFMFTAGTYLDALERFAPEIVGACVCAVKGAERDLDFTRLDEEAFQACPADSIDYAVMEKSKNLSMVVFDGAWNDLGSWKAMHAIGKPDAQGNVAIGDVLSQDVSGCYLHANNRLVAALGLRDTIVVETSDAVLVADNGRVQEIKSIVSTLRKAGRYEADSHPIVYRPWGSFQSILTSDRFQVKLLRVKPGEILSLQKHHHRAEHWVVVNGTAMITNGDQEFLLSEDESTYIPLGNVHRLANPGKIPLDIIEVQTGSYLGEDDIVRLEDKYAR